MNPTVNPHLDFQRPESAIEDDRTGLSVATLRRALADNLFYVQGKFVDSLMRYDPYLIFADYEAYIKCQEQVSEAYKDREKWTRMSILNTARMGKFSSDRAIREYCEEIWNTKPVVDEAALADALRNEVIAAAATDVFAEEPPIAADPLLQAKEDNILFSPHIAGVSRESARRIMMMSAENIIRVLAGQGPLNVVNP